MLMIMLLTGLSLKIQYDVHTMYGVGNGGEMIGYSIMFPWRQEEGNDSRRTWEDNCAA